MQKTMHPHLIERKRLQLHVCLIISVHSFRRQARFNSRFAARDRDRRFPTRWSGVSPFCLQQNVTSWSYVSQDLAGNELVATIGEQCCTGSMQGLVYAKIALR